MSIKIIEGDAREVLKTLPDRSLQCCVTSPPYYGLRDYGMPGQIGLEQTPNDYVAEMVAVFREVRPVLADDGTVWLNIGDSYAGGGGGNYGGGKNVKSQGGQQVTNIRNKAGWLAAAETKPKDLLGIPWMVAFALRTDGWYLRSDIIWHKPAPMPESVTDRPTSAHEHVFLLTKQSAYFYNAEAIAEPSIMKPQNRFTVRSDHPKGDAGRQAHTRAPGGTGGDSRNSRNVWTIASQPYSGAHFATMPPELAERCIKAGSRKGDTVLDPFSGAGTTALVASRLGRSSIGIELNPTYATLARNRIHDDCPMFSGVAAE